jgi:hypothetical protein
MEMTMTENWVTLPQGVTLRDYFAAHAPPKPDNWQPSDTKVIPHDDAAWAYAYADAMLAQREPRRRT